MVAAASDWVHFFLFNERSFCSSISCLGGCQLLVVVVNIDVADVVVVDVVNNLLNNSRICLWLYQLKNIIGSANGLGSNPTRVLWSTKY